MKVRASIKKRSADCKIVKRKGGKEDLKKAVWYINRLINED